MLLFIWLQATSLSSLLFHKIHQWHWVHWSHFNYSSFRCLSITLIPLVHNFVKSCYVSLSFVFTDVTINDLLTHSARLTTILTQRSDSLLLSTGVLVLIIPPSCLEFLVCRQAALPTSPRQSLEVWLHSQWDQSGKLPQILCQILLTFLEKKHKSTYSRDLLHRSNRPLQYDAAILKPRGTNHETLRPCSNYGGDIAWSKFVQNCWIWNQLMGQLVSKLVSQFLEPTITPS